MLTAILGSRYGLHSGQMVELTARRYPHDERQRNFTPWGDVGSWSLEVLQ